MIRLRASIFDGQAPSRCTSIPLRNSSTTATLVTKPQGSHF